MNPSSPIPLTRQQQRKRLQRICKGLQKKAKKHQIKIASLEKSLPSRVLRLAICCRDVDMVRFILTKCNVDINDYNTEITTLRNTWLMEVCYPSEQDRVDGGKSQQEIARLLLEHGASINHPANTAWSVLHLAIIVSTEPFIELLVDAGASLTQKCADYYFYPYSSKIFTPYEYALELEPGFLSDRVLEKLKPAKPIPEDLSVI